MSISERGQGGGGAAQSSATTLPLVSTASEGDHFYETDTNTLWVCVKQADESLVWIDISTSGHAVGGWLSSGSAISTVDEDAKVGIGRTPVANLDILATGSGSAAHDVLRLNLDGSGAQAPRISVQSNGTTGFEVSHSSAFTKCRINHDYSGAAELILGLQGDDLFTLYDTTGHADLVGTLTEGSDSRLKENIADLDKGVEFINALRPVSYTRKDHEDSKTHYGLIAQEVEAVDGGASNLVHHRVSEGDEENAAVDRYSLAYTQLIAPLIKSVQELSARVVELEAKLGEQ